MNRQRKLVQSKIVKTTPEKDLNDMDLVTLPEKRQELTLVS